MKRSEAIEKYYDKIKADMVELYRSVIECDGRIQYGIYIWEDGELEHLEEVQGGTGWLKPRDYEPRELYYVTTIYVDPSFDIWDCSESGAPDDEDEREAMREEIIDWLVDDYKANVSDTLDSIIEDVKRREKYDD